jgi:hypothetical protein
MKPSADEILAFFSAYPPAVQDIAPRLRAIIRSAIPDAREMLDRSNRIVGYGFGPGYADLICTIIPSKKGVKLGVVRGPQIPDPAGLLEGPGKKHRYVAFSDASDLDRPGLQSLLRAAVAVLRDGKTNTVRS